MTGYPIVLNGEGIAALVVGGGEVALRKVMSLLDVGANVTVVAPDACGGIQSLAEQGKIRFVAEHYSPRHLDNCNLVFATTNSPEVNLQVARDARALRCLVNVASDATRGDFSTPATHRDGPLVIAVYADGVPSASMRIRDRIRDSLGKGLGAALTRLAELRRSLLGRGERTRWDDASRDMIGEDFMASVSSGEFEKRYSRWR